MGMGSKRAVRRDRRVSRDGRLWVPSTVGGAGQQDIACGYLVEITRNS